MILLPDPQLVKMVCRFSRLASGGSATVSFSSCGCEGGTGLSRLARLLSLSRSDHAHTHIRWWQHSRRNATRNGISTPTPASQPAFRQPRMYCTTICPPLPHAECHARPLHASRESVPCALHPSIPYRSPILLGGFCYLQTSVPNTANDDVAVPPASRFTHCQCHTLVRAVLVFSLLQLTTSPLRTCVCLTWTAFCPGDGKSIRSALHSSCLLHSTSARLFFLCVLARASEVGSLVIRSAQGRRSPSKPRQLLGPPQIGRSLGTVFVL